MSRTFALLAALVVGISASSVSAQATTSSGSPASTATDGQRAVRWAFDHDPHGTEVECRHILRLEVPTPQLRQDRRTRRLERTGWALVGFGLVSGLVAGLAVGLNGCNSDEACILSGPLAGTLTGALVATVPLLVGSTLGVIGAVRRRRARRAGTWSFALRGAGGAVALLF